MGIRAVQDAPAGTGGRGCARVGGTRGEGRSSLEMPLQNRAKGAREMPGIRRPWLPAGFVMAGALSGNSAGEALCPWPCQAAVARGLLGTAPGAGRASACPLGQGERACKPSPGHAFAAIFCKHPVRRRLVVALAAAWVPFGCSGSLPTIPSVLCFPGAFGEVKTSTTTLHSVSLGIVKHICSTIIAQANAVWNN